MLVVMIGIRKSLDLIFTRRELKILDDIMPETTKPTVILNKDQDHQLENGSKVGFCKKTDFQNLCDGSGINALMSAHSKNNSDLKISNPLSSTHPLKDSAHIPEVEIRLLN